MEWIKYSLVYTADSIRKFDSKSNRTADSIRASIRTQKKTIRRSLALVYCTSCSVNVRLRLTRQTDDTFTAGTVVLFPDHVQSLVGCKLTEYVELLSTASLTDCTIIDNSHPSVLHI